MKSIRMAVIITALTCSLSAQSQNKYRIDFKIKNFKDSVAYLGFYFWENHFVADTAVVKNGNFVFEGSRKLAPGVYMLLTNGANGKVRLMDMVMGEDQTFSMESTNENLVKDMKVIGDPDNQLFFDNQRYYAERSVEAEPYAKILRDSLKAEVDKTKAREELNLITAKVKAHHIDLIKKYPATVTARIIKANQEIEIPENISINKDQALAYRYYKAHYWDNINLADEVLIHLPNPLYKEKLKFYLDKMVVQNPDSLIKEIDSLATIARKNKETYKFLIWKTITDYQSHPIMGMDQVYVHMSDKYIASGELDFWINEKTKKNIVDYAAQLRRSLIGQQAANLIMQDQNFQPRNMYDLAKKYTILFIFDPDCPHCREETPKLVSFYNKNQKKYDLEVFAVCSDSSMNKMRNFIKEMNTPWITVNGPRSYVGSYDNLYDAKLLPSLYILDDKKKIIAKKPPIESIEDFLNHYEQLKGK